MGKPSRERALPDNEAKAVTRNLRVSPQKLNLVAGLIRGKKVDQAIADLQFSRKRIANDVRKCVMSAVANAENNHGLDVNDLIVAEAWVGKNLIMFELDGVNDVTAREALTLGAAKLGVPTRIVTRLG